MYDIYCIGIEQCQHRSTDHNCHRRGADGRCSRSRGLGPCLEEERRDALAHEYRAARRHEVAQRHQQHGEVPR